MSFFFSLMQLFGWVAFGWFLHSSNWWAVAACAMFSALCGLFITMDSVGKALQHASTNQPE